MNTITDDQIRDLQAYATQINDHELIRYCLVAQTRPRSRAIHEALDYCAFMYAGARFKPEWEMRHLPPGAFQVAEMIAEFVMDQAHENSERREVHDKLVDVATRIRTADWIKDAR